MGSTIGPSVFFTGFTTAGVHIDGGHECLIQQAWFAECEWSDSRGSAYMSICLCKYTCVRGAAMLCVVVCCAALCWWYVACMGVQRPSHFAAPQSTILLRVRSTSSNMCAGVSN